MVDRGSSFFHFAIIMPPGCPGEFEDPAETKEFDFLGFRSRLRATRTQKLIKNKFRHFSRGFWFLIAINSIVHSKPKNI